MSEVSLPYMSTRLVPHRRGVLTAAAVVALAVAPLLTASPASAASPTLSLSQATTTGAKAFTVTVSGRGYLVPPHGAGTDVFGGVYVFFGAVKAGAWGPSAGGAYGNGYVYPGEQGDASDRSTDGGTTQFVSFTDAGTSGEATTHHMADDGSWSVAVRVPAGPTFDYMDAAGDFHTVDCRTARCGVFTIGAHGKVSSTNEVYAPIRYTTKVAPGPTSTPKPTKTTRPTPSPTPEPTRTTASPTSSRTASSAPATAAPPTPSASPTAAATTAPPATPSATATGPSLAPVLAPTPSATASLDAALASVDTPGSGGGAVAAWAVGGVVVLAAVGGAATYLVRRRPAG